MLPGKTSWLRYTRWRLQRPLVLAENVLSHQGKGWAQRSPARKCPQGHGHWLTLKYTVPRSFTMVLCSSFSSAFISQDSLACRPPREKHSCQLPESPAGWDLTSGEGSPWANPPSQNSSGGLHTSAQHLVGCGTFPSQHCQKHSCGDKKNSRSSQQHVTCSTLKRLPVCFLESTSPSLETWFKCFLFG